MKQLLYSVAGYEIGGTKRALIRYDDEPAKEGGVFQLIDRNGRPVLQGKVENAPVTFALHFRACDFSSCRREGVFQLKILFPDGGTLLSDAFPIGKDIWSKQFLIPLSVHNSEARLAEKTCRTGGYYDCNSMMGEAYSHGIFMNALLQLPLWKKELAGDTPERLIHYAQIAFDYLLPLIDEDCGIILNSSRDRPVVESHFGKIINTQEGLYGLTAYMDLCREKDPERASPENYEKLRKVIAHLESGPELDIEEKTLYPSGEDLAVDYFHLFRYSGDKLWLDKAVDTADRLLHSVHVESAPRNPWRGIPLFEGVYLLCTAYPELMHEKGWDKEIHRHAQAYHAILSNSALHFTPPTVNDSAEEWQGMSRQLIDRSDRANVWFGNENALTIALDACFLGMLDHDIQMEKIAAGQLQFIMGVNFGFSPDMVQAIPGSSAPTTACFIANTPINHAKPWSTWYYRPRNDQWYSTVNGYQIRNGQFAYTDCWETAETFIKTDGLLLYAMCVYESWLKASCFEADPV